MPTKFPPIVNSYFPPFIDSVDSIEIPFSYGIEEPSGEWGIKYKILDSKTNVLIHTGEASVNKNKHTVTIDTSKEDADENIIYQLQVGNIYKLQLCYKYSTFQSEWSSVCYLKPINEPIFNIDFNDVNAYIETPTFYGACEIPESNEPIKQYKFELLKNNQVMMESPWQEHVEGVIDSYIFPQSLEDITVYQLKYSIKTENGYIDFAISDPFVTAFYLLTNPYGVTITKVENLFDDGCIKIEANFSGFVFDDNDVQLYNIVLRRASSKTNYEIWEDVQYDYLIDTQMLASLDPDKKIWYDYTVENGVSYIYGIQNVNAAKQRGKLVKSKSPVMAEFEDIFLIDSQNVVKIKYNPKVTNLKRNILEQKQDTIGNQYPFILRNGNSNYFSFSLGGLISNCANNYIQPIYRNATSNNESKMVKGFNTNLSQDNICEERNYRERIESFLSNGKAKLFKSATEGNKVIYLTGVSLTPDDKVGRMLYSFTSTAYELASSEQLSALEDLDIISVGDFTRYADIPSIYFSPLNESTGLNQFTKTDWEKLNNNPNLKIDYLTHFKLLNEDPISSMGYAIGDIEGTLSPMGGAYVFNNYFNAKNINFYPINFSSDKMYITNIQGYLTFTSSKQNENDSHDAISVARIDPSSIKSIGFSKMNTNTLDIKDDLETPPSFHFYNVAQMHIESINSATWVRVYEDNNLIEEHYLVKGQSIDLKKLNSSVVVRTTSNVNISGYYNLFQWEV